jgi:hypothetical protein
VSSLQLPVPLPPPEQASLNHGPFSQAFQERLRIPTPPSPSSPFLGLSPSPTQGASQ